MRSRFAVPALALLAVMLIAAPACKSTKSLETGAAEETTGIQPAEPMEGEDASAAEELEADRWGDNQIREDEVRGTDEMDVLESGRAAMQTVYFAFDSSALSDVALRTLDENARWLKQNPGVRVTIEGHCDERGTTEYNLELGARRARAVRDHMARLGVDEGRIETISFGEERPADPGHDETAWAKNRRAEFTLEQM